MTCETEERKLTEMRRRRREAAYEVRRVTAKAELDVLRLNERIYNWGTVRLAEAMMCFWDSWCAQAEDALERCKLARNPHVIERLD
ncbi:MAG: hypothetical protein ACXV5B_08755 [Halobacteriota archaeon]